MFPYDKSAIAPCPSIEAYFNSSIHILGERDRGILVWAIFQTVGEDEEEKFVRELLIPHFYLLNQQRLITLAKMKLDAARIKYPFETSFKGTTHERNSAMRENPDLRLKIVAEAALYVLNRRNYVGVATDYYNKYD